MITCEELVEFLMDYLDGTLDPETSQALEQHLKDCQGCQAFLNTYRATLAAVRKLACEEIPADLQARLKSFLRERIHRGGRYHGYAPPPER